MPLEGKYFPTRLKVMHHFRTQHLKPFFGKSMRLAGKEKKAERKRMIRLWSEPGGYRRKKELGGRRKPEGRGEREKEQEGLAPSLRLGEGWPVMGMSFGQNKGPSWIGRPFGNKVLALFYFPT